MIKFFKEHAPVVYSTMGILGLIFGLIAWVINQGDAKAAIIRDELIEYKKESKADLIGVKDDISNDLLRIESKIDEANHGINSILEARIRQLERLESRK